MIWWQIAMWQIAIAAIFAFQLAVSIMTFTIPHLSIRGLSQIRPIPIITACPMCATPHIDEGAWRIIRHKTHLCSFCRNEWRPINAYSVGVNGTADNGLYLGKNSSRCFYRSSAARLEVQR